VTNRSVAPSHFPAVSEPAHNIIIIIIIIIVSPSHLAVILDHFMLEILSSRQWKHHINNDLFKTGRL